VVVGTTTLQPGQSTSINIAFAMHEGMGGPHHFVGTIKSNDPLEPEKKVAVKALIGQ